MKVEIEIPEGVTAELSDTTTTVKGPKGELKREFATPLAEIKKDGNKITIKSKNERREAKAIAGTIGAHLRNMIHGVQEGYIYKLRSVFSHFPVTLKVENNEFKIGARSKGKVECASCVLFSYTSRTTSKNKKFRGK